MIELEIVDEPPIDLAYIEAHVKPEQEGEATPAKEMQEIFPEEGYVLSKVTVHPIPPEFVVPDGVIPITQNGDIDVAGYATARVEVPQGIFPSGSIPIGSDGTYDVTDFAEAVVDTAPEKGIYFSDYDEDGYPHTATLKMTGQIPSKYAQNVGNDNFTKLVDTINIEEGATGTASYAFNSCANISKIVLPSTFGVVGISTFEKCSSLQEVEFLCDNVRIDVNAFHTTPNLKRLIFAKNLASIGSIKNTHTVELWDFSHATAIPLLSNKAFIRGVDGCIIRVPQSMIDDWKADEKWRDLPTTAGTPGYVVWEGV